MSKIIELLTPVATNGSGWALLPEKNYNEAIELIKQLEQDLQFYKEEYKTLNLFLNAEGQTP
jgi:hypothetical protein